MRIEGGGLILAAGRGSRYGSDKRRAILNSGRSLLETTLSVWQQALPSLRVVLRARDEPGEQELAAKLSRQFPEVAITFAADSRNGMGASLAAGIRDCVGWDYALIGLGDMPYLQAATLHTLAAALQEQIAQGHRACILRPLHQNRPGHPVGFGSDHFTALARLDGDVGARAVIQAAAQVTDVPCEDPGIHRDVDTPQALRADHS
ncbi:MAG: nucleotidyltransferase family protein [Gammaproteobacteria bacterium]|nr:nucleotidyltransferase family protein [Gammaproteobacteria bacterium]